MSLHTYRAHSYSALVDALNAMRQLPVNELIARVDLMFGYVGEP
jgi:hypothetical protein